MSLRLAGFPAWSVDQEYGAVTQHFADKIRFVSVVHNKSQLTAHRVHPIRSAATVVNFSVGKVNQWWSIGCVSN